MLVEKKTELARKTGKSLSAISQILSQKRRADLPTAIRIEKVTGGQIRVEEIVRPEVAQALKEYLRLRCSSMSKTISSASGDTKCEEKEGAYGGS